MRRTLLIVCFCLAAGPLAAADVAQVWQRQLELEGYDDITVRRTWLGRVRIVAEKNDIEREIILNRATGEVLRDYSRAEDGGFRLPLGFVVGFDDEDDEDDDDDGEGPDDD